MNIIRYNDHVKPEAQHSQESTESSESQSVTDQILAVSGDFRERMEDMTNPTGVWQQSSAEINNEGNKQKQRTYVRAILSGLAMGKSTDELLVVVEKWQRAIQSGDVGNTGLADSIALVLENATDTNADYRTASIAGSIQWHLAHNKTIPGIQPNGAQETPKKRAA
jgi:hypothetical protein